MALGAILGAAGGLLGAIAGGQGSNSSQSSTSGIRLAPETGTEQYLNPDLLKQYQALQAQGNLGPGDQDVTAGVNSQRSLADMLQNYSQGGYQPNQGDITQAGNLADQMFAQSWRNQSTDAGRMAARLGRPVNDPILQAKLRQGQADQRGQFVAQEAQRQPLQRLQFAGQLADVRSGLATQAMANRQALLGMGSQLRGQDRDWRLQTGERYGTNNQSGGGGVAGSIGGLMAGIGGGLGLASKFGSLGGGAASAPNAPGVPSSDEWSTMLRSPGSSVAGGLGTSSFSPPGGDIQNQRGGYSYNPAPKANPNVSGNGNSGGGW